MYLPNIFTDVSSQKQFGMCTVPPCRRSCRWKSQHGTILTWGIFGTRNFWHHGHFGMGYFGTWIFQHMDISTPVLLRRNVHVPCQNVPVPKIPRAEKSLCRKVPVLKRPSAGMSVGWNGARNKMFPPWNNHAKMTLAETSGGEMVGSQ